MKKFDYLVTAVIVLAVYGLYSPRKSSSTSSSVSSGDSPSDARPTANEENLPTAPREVAADSARTETPSTSTRERLAADRLQAASSQPWEIRRDEMTDKIRTIARGQLSFEKSVSARAAADQFILKYGVDLFGVPAKDLLFVSESVTDRTRVTYKQIVAGTEIYGGSLNLFFEEGSLNRIQSDLSPLEPSLGTSPTDFTLAQAFERYKDLQAGQTETTLSRQATTRTVLFPASSRLVYAYEFSVHERSIATGEVGSYRILFNAEDRILIKKTGTEIR